MPLKALAAFALAAALAGAIFLPGRGGSAPSAPAMAPDIALAPASGAASSSPATP